jgi:hypothetical protein
MSYLQTILDLFFLNLLYGLPPFFPFRVFICQCVVLYLKQSIVQKQILKLLQLVIHVGGLKNFTQCLTKCLQFALQFLNLYPKLMGTILHVNVDFC